MKLILKLVLKLEFEVFSFLIDFYPLIYCATHFSIFF